MSDEIGSVVWVVDGTPRRRRRLVNALGPVSASVEAVESCDACEQALRDDQSAVVVVPAAQAGGDEGLGRLRQRGPHAGIILLAAHDEVDQAATLAENHRCTISELPVMNPEWLRLLVDQALRASRAQLLVERVQLRDIDRAMAALGALGYRDAKAALLARFDSVYTHALLETLGKQGALERSALSTSGFRELCRRAKAAREAMLAQRAED